ncbi:MAG: pyridoxine 5'-phosphate synthase [Lentisphaerota bacterium]
MRAPRLRLGVNVDHVATVRQARGTDYPDPVKAARLCVRAGAQGITAHLREDRRHIQDRDVFALKEMLTVPLNLEMANAPEIVRIALKVKPAEVCLVPEKRQELTTEGGLDVVGNRRTLKPAIEKLQAAGIEVSLFVAPDRRQLEASADLGAPVVELHTGAYCDARGAKAQAELKRLIQGARIARDLGLQVNAGHGINMQNIAGILQMPWLRTLNIGHSIIARALMLGMKEAVREMIQAMKAYRGGAKG